MGANRASDGTGGRWIADMYQIRGWIALARHLRLWCTTGVPAIVFTFGSMGCMPACVVSSSKDIRREYGSEF